MSTSFLEDHFLRYFDILFANNADLLERVRRVRYDVYCREFQYEKEEDCPGGLEEDEYDDLALHVLAIHKASGASAGCVRMIRPPADDAAFELPMEHHCGHTFNRPERDPRTLSRRDVAEISRLAVHTSFRRRLGEGQSAVGALSAQAETDEEVRSFPLISLALFAGATALLDLSHCRNMFVMMEPRLARRLRSLGFPFVQIGEKMDYHGIRAAYHVTVEECVASWKPAMSQMYARIHQALQGRAARDGLSLD